MFRRKLTALDYSDPSDEFADTAAYRKFIVWLEDQKIRHYKVEDRTALRDVSNPNWDAAAEKYLSDLSCPLKLSPEGGDHAPLLDWLMGSAIRLEYGDNIEKYRAAGRSGKSGGAGAAANPLDSLDVESADFKAGVTSLAQLLQIAPHPDHLVVLKAICLVVSERLGKDIGPPPPSGPPGASIPLNKIDLGFETGDQATEEAAKILRLLHIRELRDLQNLANEAIVAVQRLTANPKTDTKLGKVGQS